MDDKVIFTVFTPTYNRANTLHRVHESLKAQTFRNFEWLVIDDGSTDDTEALIRTWQKEANFIIRYFRQSNQGKPAAFNRAVQEAMGILFLPFDSDDACVPEALERFYYHWQSIPADQQNRFSGVTALCRDEGGRLVGDKYPQQIIDSDLLQILYKYKIRGEKWGFHRTDLLRDFPFPILANSLYVPEGIVWSKIARVFKTRFVNEILRIYFCDSTGATNKVTQKGDPAKYAQGIALWHQSVLNDDIDWFLYSPSQFLRSVVQYSRFSFHVGASVVKQFMGLRWVSQILLFHVLSDRLYCLSKRQKLYGAKEPAHWGIAVKNIKTLYQSKWALLLGLAFLIIIETGVAALSPQHGYRIGPNDVIRIQVFGEDDLTVETKVSGDATINVPLLGVVSVKGKTIEELQEYLTARLADGYIRKPKVMASIVKHRNFYVNGEVKAPGGYPYEDGLTIHKAISMAGGFTEKAERGNMKVNRGINGVIQSIEVAFDEPVLPDDFIVVPQIRKVYVNGEVKRAGDYPYERGLTVHKVITMAGGFTDKAAESRTKVLRKVNGKEQSIPVDLETTVLPDDILVVPRSFF